MGNDIQPYSPEGNGNAPKGIIDRAVLGFGYLCQKVGREIIRRCLPEGIADISGNAAASSSEPEVRYALPPVEVAVGIPLSQYEILFRSAESVDHFIVAFLHEAQRLELLTEFSEIERVWRSVNNEAVADPFLKVVNFFDRISYPVSPPKDSGEKVDPKYFYPSRSFTPSQIREMYWAIHILASLTKYTEFETETLIENGRCELQSLRRQGKGLNHEHDIENFGRMLTKILLFLKQRKENGRN